MGNVESFITIHDQDLIFECEETGRFNDLTDYKYLFVGPRPVDKLPPAMLAKTIISRDYAPHYEHYPHLYDFTGWYTLGRHDLFTKPYVICLQYDHFIVDNCLEKMVDYTLSGQEGMISFVKAYYMHYMLQVPGFEQAMRRTLGLKGIVFEQMLPLAQWPSTQGTAWHAAGLKDFILWVSEVFDSLKNEKYAGHIAERMVTAYVKQTHPEAYLEGFVGHQSADCHGTGAAMAGREDIFFQKSITFGQ
jgi:hypothetical protein